MANFDPTSGRLQLHIVYDGAPDSGKTTSLRALARQSGRQVETPEERQGRTIYFDWLDLEGGQYRDQPIECRIIAVPGQDELASRRASILAAADAVVFVVDSTPQGFPAARAHFAGLRAYLATRERMIPIVLQLNKRDAADALDADTIQAQLADDAPTPAAESVATVGDGVRQALVQAVGEAIRALRLASGDETASQPIPTPGDLDLTDPATLFERLIEPDRQPDGQDFDHNA